MSLILALLSVVARFDSTRVTGTAVALASGKALAGVRISLGDAWATTDSTGRFTLRVPAGTRPVFDFTWGGRAGAVRSDALAADPYEIVIDTEAENLKPLIGVDDWQLPGVWGMSGFFARRAKGYGRFFTRDDFRSGGFGTLRDLLATQGVIHTCVRNDGCGPANVVGGRFQSLDIWVDGVIQTAENADSLSLAEVAGVEFYPRPGVFKPAGLTPDRKWIVDTRYFLREPLVGSMVIVWTRGFEGPTTR